MRKFIIAIDPSGNFKNGKGGTGMAYFWQTENGKHMSYETIWAKNSLSKKDYYYNIINGVYEFVGNTMAREETLVVIEDFRLQSGIAKKISNQAMETSELIGMIEAKLDDMNIKHVRQQNTVKSRWPKKLLELELKTLGLPAATFKSPHEFDASRHLLTAILWTYKKEMG